MCIFNSTNPLPWVAMAQAAPSGRMIIRLRSMADPTGVCSNTWLRTLCWGLPGHPDGLHPYSNISSQATQEAIPKTSVTRLH